MPHSEEHLSGEVSALEPIAIVGMACRLPGGVDSPTSLWETLIKKVSCQTPRVPASRFNIDAHYHENLERPGSFNVLGGYFLDEPVENFDPTFFNMTPIEAMWLDPQQRKMLEVSYECLESAGLTLESVAGSNTAVFVGSFTSDYQQMSIREPDFRHNYAATGVDPGIISNRIGNVFNLNGPSFTINTACSSSIYAIHNACHALRSRDCNAAIAGGVNLILTVDQHMNTAKLGILSPTSTCHTFDASADGYGRAEGAGALYLKRLSDAIRDGNPVRGVIRSSAVNTNGKVPGMGITHPSKKGQERVVRAAYERAQLDPARTAYLECHGTGTPVGDPIETHAVSLAMNDTRSKDKPLLVGAIKPSIGHSEAASGIFAVMKAAMMTEAAIIPGVAGFQNLNPSIREKEWNIKVQADTTSWPRDFAERRASVSSFGYGGTNGHVIVEAVESLYPWYQHGRAKAVAPYDHSSGRPFLVTFSAHDKVTLSRNISAHARIADKFYLADLAHTLNTKRTKFHQNAFTIATEGNEAESFALSSFTFGSTKKKAPRLAFLFTGQGAQWAQMGAQAMLAFPSFIGTIRELDRVLQRLEPPPSWTLEHELLASPERSRVNDPEISQPACTAIQIAIVDLFAAWDISPAVTVGHSSGEIGAAYAAGYLSAPEAILAAFFRGYAVKHYAPVGTMLAAGVGRKDVSKYISDLNPDVVIACENSPVSVTLSGTSGPILEAKKRLEADGVFARELKTGKAYHSAHMNNVAAAYESLLTEAINRLNQEDLDCCQPRKHWISSVSGDEVTDERILPSYWSKNLRNRVFFDSAITCLGSKSLFEDVTTVIEIGPHSALSAPFRQICQANSFVQLVYIPTFVRKENDVTQLLKAAGILFTQGYLVDLEAVNENIDARAGSLKTQRPLTLVDLPPYQWNYEKRYWAEPRFSHEQRNLTHLRHDLLGTKIVGLSDRSLVWKNVIRHRDIPWLQDHRLGNVDVFPAAAHLSMAIEALRQVCEANDIEVNSVTCRDVVIKVALIIPEKDDGIEVQLRFTELTRVENSIPWYSFFIESFSEGRWTLHCQGKITPNLKPEIMSPEAQHPVDISNLPQKTTARRWYDAFNRVGFEYGSSFQPLNDIRTNAKYRHAAADARILQKSSLMVGESRYLLHPSTIDACLQLIIISINKGLHKEMLHGVVPINIEECSIWFPGSDIEVYGKAVAWTDLQDGRYFNTHTRLLTPSGKLILDVKSLRCVAYEAAVPQQSGKVARREPYMETLWKPDISSLTTGQLLRTCAIESGSDATRAMVELLDHKSHLSKVLFLGQFDAHTIQGISASVSGATHLTLAGMPSANMDAIEHEINVPQNVSKILTMPDGGFDWEQSNLQSQDLIIVDKSFIESMTEETLLIGLQKITTEKRKLVLATAGANKATLWKKLTSFGFSSPELVVDLPDMLVMLSTRLGTYVNGIAHPEKRVTFFHLGGSTSALAKLSSFLKTYCLVEEQEIGRLENRRTMHTGVAVIYDIEGTLLSSLNTKSFNALKGLLLSGAPIVWVTAGVNAGQSVAGAMSQGFLRAIRSEQAAAKISLLDVDAGETPETIGHAIIDKINAISTKDSGADTEFWLHDEIVNIPRISRNVVLNDMSSASAGSPRETILVAGEDLRGSIRDAALVFSPSELDNRPELKDNELDLQVHNSELVLSDLQSQSSMPRVVTGRVLRAGKGLDPTLVGQEGAFYTTDILATLIRTPASLGGCYTDLNGMELTKLLPDLVKAVNALLEVAKVKHGEHLLLLPAPQPFIEAVIGLRRLFGFKLTVALTNQESKADVLSMCAHNSDDVSVISDVGLLPNVLEQTNFQAPDAVVAHDFSVVSQDIWRLAPRMCRFVLCEGTIEEAPDVLPFIRGASFHSTSVRGLYKSEDARLGDVLRRSLELLKNHPDIFSTKKPAIDVSLFKDIGSFTLRSPESTNAILTYSYGESMIKVEQRKKSLRFSADATYLLIGCLGGLGRSLTSWMMERGARSFAFMSRSGADKAEAAMLIEAMKNTGASVEVYRADVSNEKDVEEVVSAVSARRPIRGVVHAAMVLEDIMFERMTHQQFTAAVTPKVKGAQNLHNALQGTALDFFVMTSSISATLGNPGQANYCAANSFLDGLAWHRNLKGLPATSLILPMILGVGVVSENENIEKALSRKAMYGIDEQEMLRGFEIAMSIPAPQVGETASLGKAQIILGLEPAYLAAAIASSDSKDAYWYNDARFNGLRATVDNANNTSPSGSRDDGNIVNLLKAAQAEGGTEALLQTLGLHVAKKLSTMLMMSLDEFELDGRSVADFGLDSMIGAELRNWLFREFAMDMSFQHLLAPKMTIKVLAETVAESLGFLKRE